MNSNRSLPEKIRVSVGSAIVLGLLKGKIDTSPTTVYMLTYRDGKCLANCGFCPQARASNCGSGMLARVTWPSFSTEQVIGKIPPASEKSDVKRVCIQALNYPKVFAEVLSLTEAICSRSKVPISVSIQPLSKSQMTALKQSGVSCISIALDAATQRIFDEVKGAATLSSYTWKHQRTALAEAVEVFGMNHVYTHLIAGLGETEKEMVETIQWCVDSGVYPSLFAFTPIPGTALGGRNQPPIASYRRIQLARYLIVRGRTQSQKMKFDHRGRIIDFGMPKAQLKEAISRGTPFHT
jgi:biotin synthase-related radical SAM superfamily protein